MRYLSFQAWRLSLRFFFGISRGISRVRAIFLSIPLSILVCCTAWANATNAFDRDKTLKGYTVTDYRGTTVTLQQPAQRIIALAPHIVENLFSAGLGDRIIATVKHSDYPKAAQNIPRIGSANSYNVETLLAQKPDLVIHWSGGGHLQIIQQLENVGLTVYADDPKTEVDIIRSVSDFAILGGTESIAEQAITHFHHAVANNVLPINEKHDHAALTVFYQVWSNPLMTINGDHLISHVIERCGGRNVFAALSNRAPTLTLEALLAANPEIIIISDRATPEEIRRYPWYNLRHLKAVTAQRIVRLDQDTLVRPTLRIAEGIKNVCSALKNPAAYKKANP